MAVTHPLAIRNGLADHIVDQLDLNAPPGRIVFQTAGDVAVATLTLANPAFGAAVNGTAVAAPITSDASAVGGTIAKARLRQGGGTDIVICSVTGPGGGGDIILNSVIIASGQQVSLSSLSYSAPP
jgi:hypothetical protein